MLKVITPAREQIIIATCDVAPLDADDFDEVVLGLPRVTVASLTVVDGNPYDAKLLLIVLVFAVRVAASAVFVVPDIDTV